ncbi:MAG: hypothetical protein ABIT05_03215 [Chitinophagaceae bacterium]
MLNYKFRFHSLLLAFLFTGLVSLGQTNFKPKYNNSTIYTGIEVGSKGVKMSVIEIGKNAQSNGAFNILKDTSVNTDFISFTEATYQATLNGLYSLYTTATKEYKIPSKRVFTVISSGVKMQAEKETKYAWVSRLIDSFRIKIDEPRRQVEVVDVMKEALLSHLGIVPETRRFTTFLIDIGSGNTKGGFFPYGNTNDFKLFQLTWGTKSTANATEKNCGDDKSLVNYNKQLFRVLAGAENSEIIYSVNSSGAYPVSDNIAVSGGIAWAVATLTHPELLDNSVISVSYDEIVKFSEKLFNNYDAFAPALLAQHVSSSTEKETVLKETKRVQQVFDQKALMAGTGLLLKIMRQFASAFETKQFYLVKNGQVGWVSAYVDQAVDK